MFDSRNPRDGRRDLTPAVAFPGGLDLDICLEDPPDLTQNQLFYRLSGSASVTLHRPTLGLQVEQAAPWPPFVIPPVHIRPSAAHTGGHDPAGYVGPSI